MTAVMAAPVALEPVPIAGSLPLEDAPTAAPPPGTPDASHSAPEQTRRSSAASEDTAPSGTETGGETVFMSCYLAALKRCEAKYTDPFQAAHAAPTDAPPLATTKLRILCPDEERAAPLSPAPQHTEQHVPTDAPAATGDAPAPAPIQAPVVQASGPYVCAQPGVVAGPGGTFQQIYILQPTAAGPVLAPAHAPAPAVQAHTHAAPVTSPQRAAKRTREAAAVQPARGDAAARSPEHTGSSAAPCKLCGVPSMPAGQGFCGECHEYQRYAKRLGYRLLDVRQAVHAGALGGAGKALSQDAFHAVMKAFMSGDYEEGGKQELQAGARAERMSKRNRGRPTA